MDLLRINNDYSFYISDNEEVKNKLYKALRFREKNYFHSTLYKQKKWDGFVNFFDKDNGKFLTGLLPEIEGALQHFNVPYHKFDLRESLPLQTTNIDKNFLSAYGRELYDYQVDYINCALKYQRGVIFAPAGSGKSLTIIGILKALLPNTPALIATNTTSLISQIYDDCIKYDITGIGRCYDQFFEPNVVTCANIQSAHKIDNLLPHIRVLIVDEIHAMMSKIPKRVYRKMKQAYMRIALSATPFKFGGTDYGQKYSVKGYFGPVFKTQATDAIDGFVTTEVLQKRKTLSGSECTFYHITEPELLFEIYQDAYTKGIAESYYFHDIVTRLTKTLTGRTLILVERLQHGNALAEMIPGALWVKGEDNLSTRKAVIKQLQESKENVVAIATHGIFNTGINFFLNNLVNAAGGQAEHQIIQRMGRGLRTAEDKDVLHYYDFIFKINDYLLDHSEERVKILQKEGHHVTIKDEFDF